MPVGPGPMLPVAPVALLGGPAFGLFAGDRPWLGPLLPVVLPFSEVPVVVELAASPPDAELPPAVAPEELPGLCANAAEVATANVVAKTNVVSFIRKPPWLERGQPPLLFVVPKRT